MPIDRVRPADDGVALDYSVADVEALEPLHESQYLRAGELVVTDPDWDIGTQDVLALPVYQELNGMGSAIDPDPHVMVSYDRIPKHEVEIRRSRAVLDRPTGITWATSRGFSSARRRPPTSCWSAVISGGDARSLSRPPRWSGWRTTRSP